MNRNCYRTIFSKRLGMLVPVAELAPTQGKDSGSTGAQGGSRAQASRPPGRIREVALAVALALWGKAALASPPLPTGAVITSGSGAVSQSGNTLTVNQGSQSLATNWQSFDIGAEHAVVFNQPNSSAVALNRVVGPEASSIYGSLTANGHVFLVNPNGVLFAPGAQVSTGGLVASTLSISDEDFTAGRYRFKEGAGKGAVVNQGHIEAGSVALIGPQVINSGTIRTPNGNTTLAAGDRVTVHMLDGLLSADVDASVVNAEIQNHGCIIADGGSVALRAGRADSALDALINTDGMIQAHSLRNENGKIYLDAGAGGTVYVSGTLDASGTETSASGGEVTVLGKNVGLMQGSQIDASGDTGGGTVLIGGNWQGKGPEHNAEAVHMDQHATIRADAIGNGDAGTVVLWSDKYTGFYGEISARGGVNGGNGGQVETSSHNNLQAFGSVDARAAQGLAGQWLLDPTNVTIVTGSTNTGVTESAGVFDPTVTAGSQIGVANISTNLNNGTSVTINTASGGTEAGNITQNTGAAISKTAGVAATLTLNASGAITLDGGISSTSNALAVTLNAGGGAVSGSAAINTNGGLLTINAASGSGTLSGLISGAGGLTKQGAGTTTLTGNNTYSGGTTVSAGTLTGRGGGGSGFPITPFGSQAIAVATGATAVVDNTPGTNHNNFSNEFTGAGTVSYRGSSVNRLLSPATLSGFTGTVSIDQNVVQLYGANTTATLNVSNGARFGVWAASGNSTFGALTGSGTVSGVPAAGVGGTLTIGNGGGSGTFSGLIANDAGTMTLVKTGNGTQTLSGANTYTGATTVNGGTLAITNASGLGTTAGGTTVNTGATLDLRSVVVGVEAIALNGGTLATSTGTSSLAGTVALGTGGGTLDVGGTQLTVSGVTSGADALTKSGAGTAILTSNNTYGGATTIAAGTLQVGNNGASGTLGAGAVTNNANLVFDRSDSVSLATLAGGGISGTGNVTALIGGNLTVDRAIAMSGVASSILLEAGKGVAAGTASGGDVTLTSNVGTSASGTISIFSGNAATAGYEANVSGATGPTRYKTYDASASDASGAVTGTRNYYYRQQPVLLSVSGITASKVYDGLLDASGALSGSTAVVNGVLDGDLIGYGDLTITGASFDSAHAGTRTLNVSFGSVTPATYASGGANWSVSGYDIASFSDAAAGTITPRTLSTAISGVGKVYDGLTGTSSTFNAPSGFIGGDSAAVTGLSLAFDDPNAGTRNVVASGTGIVTDFTGAASGNSSGIGAGNEVAGLASDYTVTAPSSTTAVISQAPLAITANDDAKIVTQTDAASYNGVSFSGFVNGETATNLTGTLSITRSNTGTEAAGDYAGVLIPAGYSSGNYAITYVNGDYQILAAQQLLIRLQNVTSDYGASVNYVVTGAEYLDGSGASLRALTQTAQNGNTYTYSDGAGGSVMFTVTPEGAVFSSAGHLAVGNYELAGIDATIGGSNFVGLDYVGNHAVTPLALTPLASGLSKEYDGTTGMSGLSMALSGLLTGDMVDVSAVGAFYNRNAGSNLGYDINNVTLSGADAGNYYLTSSNFSGTDGLITPRTITVSGITPGSRMYDGTLDATLATAGHAFGGVVSGDAVLLDASGYSALFGDKNVGIGKSVTVSGLALSGTDAGNYLLTQPSGFTADITPRVLTLSGVSADDRVYDGTTVARLTTSGYGLGGLVSGEAVLLDASGYSALFGDKHVGTGKSVTVSGLGLTGTGAANYLLTQPAGLMASITPASLTISAVPNIKTYDGTTSAAGMPLVTGGSLMTGDRFVTLAGAYASAEVGTGLTLMPLVAIDDGNGGANYVLTLVNDTSGEILTANTLPSIPTGAAGANTAAGLEHLGEGDNGSADSGGPGAAQGKYRRDFDEDYRRRRIQVITSGLRLPAHLGASALDTFDATAQ